MKLFLVVTFELFLGYDLVGLGVYNTDFVVLFIESSRDLW